MSQPRILKFSRRAVSECASATTAPAQEERHWVPPTPGIPLPVMKYLTQGWGEERCLRHDSPAGPVVSPVRLPVRPFGLLWAFCQSRKSKRAFFFAWSPVLRDAAVRHLAADAATPRIPRPTPDARRPPRFHFSRRCRRAQPSTARKICPGVETRIEEEENEEKGGRWYLTCVFPAGYLDAATAKRHVLVGLM